MILVRIVSVLLCSLFLALLCGCASIEGDTEQAPLPWNEPAGWEKITFGIPM